MLVSDVLGVDADYVSDFDDRRVQLANSGGARSGVLGVIFSGGGIEATAQQHIQCILK
jgi:hypothetical protein